MNRDKILFLPVILFIIFICGYDAYGSPSVKISSDAFDNRVEVGESFHISIEAINCAGKIEVSQMPPGVKVVYHTTQKSSSHTISNGRYEENNITTLIMTCKGVTPGNYTFGPVSVDGKKSNKINYQVIASTAGNNSGNQTGKTTNATPSGYDPNGGPLFVGKGNEEMFLKANVNKTTVFEQEAIEYTVKLYTTYGDIKFLGATAAPKFDGFVVDESDDVSTSFVFEDYNGKTYKTAIIARYIIFPQKSGKLTVKGNTYTVSTDAKQYYHDPYFQQMTVKYPIQLNVTPNDVIIDVKDLPTPIPDNFIGGVGKFNVKSSMPNKNLSTNTAASVIYIIEGTGNVKYVKMPDMGKIFPSSIEVYTPKVIDDAKPGKSTVSGSIKFDYSIVPRETGDFLLPSMTLSYFDPEDGEYKQIKTESFQITVAQGQMSDKSQQAVMFNSNLMEVGKLKKDPGKPYLYSALYWLWYIIPIIIMLASLAIYRKYLKDHEDLVALRSKKANKMALKRLAKAYQCFKNNQEEEFYDEMLAALWGYIGDKLKMPTSELNRHNVSDEFQRHNVNESTFMPILNLIDECEYAKYTPVAREANMRQLYADALESLGNVEKEYEEISNNKVKDSNIETEDSVDNYINSSAPLNFDEHNTENFENKNNEK